MATASIAIGVSFFSESDFADAFNEWSRRDKENPEAMDAHMDDLVKQHNNDEGKAASAMIFSILNDLKGTKNGTV